MRNILYAASILLLLALPTAAQEFRRAELFGGYQYTRVGGVLGTNGWNAAITGNLNRWFGVTGDFSGLYQGQAGASAKAQTFTAGPVVALRGTRVTPFAHALIGGFHASAGFQSAGASTTGWVVMVGGGVDVKVTRAVAVRIIQGDWITWHAQGLTENKNGRLSTGLVFKF